MVLRFLFLVCLTTKVFADTEAGILCIENCSSEKNSLFLENISVLNQICPEFIIKRQILRDHKSSLTTDSPDQICSGRIDVGQFKNSFEFEAYIQQNPFFSDFKDDAFSLCLSQKISINKGWGLIDFQTTKSLPEEKHKLALAEYYSSVKRLSDGALMSLQNIAAIDMMLDSSPLLTDVSCDHLEDYVSEQFKDQCSSLKQCSSSVENSSKLRESARNTLVVLQAVEKIDREIKRLRGPRNQKFHKNKNNIQELEDRKRSLLNLYPWTLGRVFKDSYDSREYLNYTAESSSLQNRRLENKMSALIETQLSRTRSQLKKRKDDLLKASACIRTNQFCNEVDMDKVLASAPPLDHALIFNRERRKALIEKNRKDNLTEDEKTELRSLLNTDNSAEILFSYADCLNIQRQAVQEVNKEIAHGAIDVGLAVGTFGLGTSVAAGKIALRIGGLASKAQKLSRAKRLQNLGIFGMDTSLSFPYINEALSLCGDLINQLEEEESKSFSCESMEMKAKLTSDVKGCVLRAGLASLPVTLPLLGVSGLFVVNRIKNNSITSKNVNIEPPSVGSVKSPRPEGFEEVGLVQYPKFNKEADMAKQGLHPGMFQGLDEAYKLNYLADHLRKSNIDPSKTHIEDFSKQILGRIRHVREDAIDAIETLSKSQGERRERLFDELALEASKRQKEKRVTYEWWLQWNYRLTQALEPRSLSKMAELEDIINQFPNVVALPTRKDLGIMAINKSISENVFPLGIAVNSRYADGVDMDPSYFFTHDINHIILIAKPNRREVYDNSSTTLREFYEKLQNQDIPVAQREQVELVHFLLTHELGNPGIVFSNGDFLVNNPTLMNQFMRDETLLQFIPQHLRNSRDETEEYVREAGDVYTRLQQQIVKEQ